MTTQDLVLARKATDGDQEAFRQIYEDNYKAIYYHVARILGDRGDAEDMTQEVFMRAYQFMGSYSGDASLNRWLRKVATNLCIDKMRKRAIPTVAWPSVVSKEGEEQDVEFADDGLSPLDRVESFEARDIVMDAVMRLPDYYRNVVVLHDLMEYKGDEVAEAVSCPVGTVKSRLSRAHGILRTNLSAERGIA
ncbi:MAG: RNA polymerase sigma factor [Bacillota bacterium]